MFPIYESGLTTVIKMFAMEFRKIIINDIRQILWKNKNFDREIKNWRSFEKQSILDVLSFIFDSVFGFNFKHKISKMRLYLN